MCKEPLHSLAKGRIVRSGEIQSVSGRSMYGHFNSQWPDSGKADMNTATKEQIIETLNRGGEVCHYGVRWNLYEPRKPYKRDLTTPIEDSLIEAMLASGELELVEKTRSHRAQLPQADV